MKSQYITPSIECFKVEAEGMMAGTHEGYVWDPVTKTWIKIETGSDGDVDAKTNNFGFDTSDDNGFDKDFSSDLWD